LKLKQAIQNLAIFLIGGLFLYVVFRGVEWNLLAEKMSQANFYWIAAGMAVGLISHYLRAIRAIMLYNPMGYQIPTRNSFYAVMIGYMMNYIIPRAGELSRCAALNKTDDIPVQKALGTVITERIVDVFILALILALVFSLNFSLLFSYIQETTQYKTVDTGTNSARWIILTIAAMFILGIFVFKNSISSMPLYQKILSFVKGFAEGLTSIRKVKNPGLFILLSIGIWLCYVLMMYLCLFAMSATEHLSFMNALVVFAIGTIGIVIPAPAAGAGTYHFAVTQSLLLFGIAEADGVAYATLVHGAQMIILLLFGGLCSILVILATRNKNNRT
jgi:uncharacterized protein (TIRG00374 family)